MSTNELREKVGELYLRKQRLEKEKDELEKQLSDYGDHLGNISVVLNQRYYEPVTFDEKTDQIHIVSRVFGDNNQLVYPSSKALSHAMTRFLEVKEELADVTSQLKQNHEE